jgi:uncharacterized protein YlzI (FlbEa/FlbD family)
LRFFKVAFADLECVTYQVLDKYVRYQTPDTTLVNGASTSIVAVKDRARRMIEKIEEIRKNISSQA